MANVDLRVERVTAPVRQQVYLQLKRAITEGRFAEGQRLIERELTEMAGVSRPTIREALQQLVADRLVTTMAGKGWVVASMTVEEHRDLYEVRALLEGLAARRFIERAEPADVAELRDAFREIDASLGTDRDIGRMMECKDAFYQVLFRGARSETITSQITSLHSRINLARARSLLTPGRPEQSVREIRRIVKLIVARDADGAEQACIEHVRMAAAVACLDGEQAQGGASAAPVSRARDSGNRRRAVPAEQSGSRGREVDERSNTG